MNQILQTIEKPKDDFKFKFQTAYKCHRIGKKKFDDALKLVWFVGEKSHEIRQEYGRACDRSLGSALGMRLASPIIVSAIPGEGEKELKLIMTSVYSKEASADIQKKIHGYAGWGEKLTMEIKRYLFLFTVGPVHSFIEQARKLRDLYAGSRIFIDLTESGIKTVLSYGNARIIFPYFKVDDKEVNFPNRFVAEIETEDIQAIGRAAEETVRERFIHMLP